MMTGHREAENTAKQLRDAFGSRVHDDIAIPLGDIDYFRMQHAYIAKSSTNFLLDVIIKQNELIADLRMRALDIDYFRMQYTYPTKSSTNYPLDTSTEPEHEADLRHTAKIAQLGEIDVPKKCTESAKPSCDIVSHPNHYNAHAKECIVEMYILFGVDKFIDFCTMNAWKYRYRAGSKQGSPAAQDNAKADRYIEYARRAREIDHWALDPTRLTDDEYWSKQEA